MTQLLQAGPPLEVPGEVVEAPELGGAVKVRGLMASELFAVSMYRQQATKRISREYAEHLRRCKAVPEGQPMPDWSEPQMDFAELRAYGLYISHMLACAVTAGNGLALYSSEEWEQVGGRHPGLVNRLQTVVERLSGLDAEDVEKNLPSGPNSGSG